jgi:succinylarginine dihydrolase
MVQALWLPLERPDLRFWRQMGFCGSAAEVLTQAATQAPYLLQLAMIGARP